MGARCPYELDDAGACARLADALLEAGTPCPLFRAAVGRARRWVRRGFRAPGWGLPSLHGDLRGGALVKALLVALALGVSSTTLAADAYWTGRVEYVTTVTYRQGVSCEYNYLGQTFWRTFLKTSCPVRVEVE